MDGSDPVAALLEVEESRADVAGYAIRLLMTRFGRLFFLDGSDAVGFATLAEAAAFAEQNPRP
jgi:hypothetical protein